MCALLSGGCCCVSRLYRHSGPARSLQFRFPKTSPSPAEGSRSRTRWGSIRCPTARDFFSKSPGSSTKTLKSATRRLRHFSRRSGSRPRRHADADASRPSEVVPLPLTADRWSEAVFHRRVPRDEIVSAILTDRNASLLCHGLASLDDQTLEFFSEHPSLVARLEERSAPLFGAFAGHLHVHANRVVPPGDDGATPLWETAVGEKVTRPERFVLALYEKGEGGLAYLYDPIGSPAPPRRAFALGASAANAAARL